MEKTNTENRDHSLISDLLATEDAPTPVIEGEEEEQEADDSEEEQDTDSDEGQEEQEESEEEESEEESEEEETEEEESGEEETEEEESEEDEPLVVPPYDAELREFFPDREFNTNADYQAATTEMITTLLEERRAELQANEDLVQIFQSNPRILEAVRLLKKGYSDVAAFAAAGIIPEDQVPENDKNLKDVVKRNLEREQQRKQAEESQRRIEQNAKKTEKEVADWKRKRGIPDARMKDFETKVEKFINHFIEVDYNEEILDLLYNGFYANEIKAKAEDKGRIQGRNEQIQVRKTRKSGDGIPKLTGSQPQQRNDKKYADDFDRLLDNALKDA